MSHSEILLEAGTNELEIIEFFILEDTGDEKPRPHYFGINVAKVLEVIESPKRVPAKSAVHPSFFGAIPLRERILPVLDLSVLLDLPRARSNNEIILVTEFNNKVTGFLASGVTQIYRVEWSEVEPPAKTISQTKLNCVNGLVQLDGHFVLLLDLERFLADFDPDFDGKLNAPITAAKTRYHALLVEDSRTMQGIISQRLTQANFAVRTAENGLQACDILDDWKIKSQSQDAQPLDIIISDIEMPRMDGFALTKRIKADPAFKGMPVVLFSSLITESLRHKGQSVGADDQVSKPEFSELALRCEQLIEKYRADSFEKF